MLSLIGELTRSVLASLAPRHLLRLARMEGTVIAVNARQQVDDHIRNQVRKDFMKEIPSDFSVYQKVINTIRTQMNQYYHNPGMIDDITNDVFSLILPGGKAYSTVFGNWDDTRPLNYWLEGSLRKMLSNLMRKYRIDSNRYVSLDSPRPGAKNDDAEAKTLLQFVAAPSKIPEDLSEDLYMALRAAVRKELKPEWKKALFDSVFNENVDLRAIARTLLPEKWHVDSLSFDRMMGTPGIHYNLLKALMGLGLRYKGSLPKSSLDSDKAMNFLMKLSMLKGMRFFNLAKEYLAENPDDASGLADMLKRTYPREFAESVKSWFVFSPGKAGEQIKTLQREVANILKSPALRSIRRDIAITVGAYDAAKSESDELSF